MAWAAIIPAALSVFQMMTQKDPTQVQPNYYNAWGESGPIAGAVTSRDYLLGQLNSAGFQQQLQGLSAQNIANQQAVASNPAWQGINQYGQNLLSGNYLQSPLVNNYANQAYSSIMSQNANTQARLAQSFARSGQGMSTGMMQAAQANTAAAAQKAATTKAGILMQNYQQERAMQNAAPSILQSGLAEQSAATSNLVSSLFQPLQMQAGITTQLNSGGQWMNPTLMQQPGLGNYLASGISQAGALSSLYSNLYGSGQGQTGNGSQDWYDQPGNSLDYEDIYGAGRSAP